MTRDEAWTHFYSLYVTPSLDEYAIQLERYYNSHAEELTADFIRSFRQLCLDIRAEQTAGRKGKIGYITYSMRRTYLLEQRYELQIHAYSKEWFFDPDPYLSSYDCRWALEGLGKLEKDWIAYSRRYMGKVDLFDVEPIKLEKAPGFARYVNRLLRTVLPAAVQLAEFQAVSCEPELEVYAGEYKGRMELVFQQQDNQ